MKEKIHIKQHIAKPVEKVWDLYTKPEHVIQWNHASDDWHSTKAINDLRIGGRFSYRMEAKDGSFGFDFEGTYVSVVYPKHIAYTMDDQRFVTIEFHAKENETNVDVIFEAESENDVELQRQGWQAILDNFKKYADNL
ncbi:MAG: hypothetical protein A2Y45_07720 [Tenericutes bacterium GWC2_34_14]|nr:MAG: hypothetical protein A2Z84_02410 [Tenericutes bacterium GWA2_35_7]OHE29787.1 MAG: hypothetical protein A2Y45_07720 [Tenericutes bacterium GWC2_34_14]OHE34766.1 MAG: hypothetical protein A2012_01330 [Tenericutes bacterium GWE2_34_108]OHE37373.1 MAG: hypothetical protein A2Y46_01680 [Tenericutes bacterium GWF1_35_14]OHE39494.1 MAG: hypothetical protein A2Y44_01180 [Tenericutes bacterium GWF2_35_184]OHE42577.1 MAG: hypothetical protein A3K26_04280 [Tenericutes bacterium RIFOXYA12_FULL_35_